MSGDELPPGMQVCLGAFFEDLGTVCLFVALGLFLAQDVVPALPQGGLPGIMGLLLLPAGLGLQRRARERLEELEAIPWPFRNRV